MKKVYFPILAYGGVCRAEFAMSAASLFVRSIQDHKNVSFISTGIFFESLISRGRNAAAAGALHYECDYLLFVDVDVAFDSRDVFKLISHDKDVVCGLYTKKYYSKEKINFLAANRPDVFKTDEWKSLATDFSSESDPRFISSLKAGNTLVPVKYAATGFMLIKTSVFRSIAKARLDLKYHNEVDGYMNFGDNFYNFFPSNINPETKKYESEDYGFCNLWRSLGGVIYAAPSIKLVHIGSHPYEGDIQKQIGVFP